MDPMLPNIVTSPQPTTPLQTLNQTGSHPPPPSNTPVDSSYTPPNSASTAHTYPTSLAFCSNSTRDYSPSLRQTSYYKNLLLVQIRLGKQRASTPTTKRLSLHETALCALDAVCHDEVLGVFDRDCSFT